MPEYLTPGVYIEEVPGQKPIEGVGTATGAFIGISTRGPIGQPELITNWTQFVNTYGSFTPKGYLAYSVNQFFQEGGTRCFVVRTCHYDGDPKKPTALRAVGALGGNTLKATATGEGEWGNNVMIKTGDASDKNAEHFKLTVAYKSDEEVFDNLTMNEATADYVEFQVDKISKFVTIDLVDPANRARPANGELTLAGGKDGLEGLTEADFIGDEALRTGLHALDVIDDVNIIAISDFQSFGLIKEATAYCELRKDCFFVADPPPGLKPAGNGSVVEFKSGLTSAYGALYYPWVLINDPLNGKRKLIPPSGSVVGTYSATDVKRGVHKAPAGTIDGYLNTVVDVAYPVTKGEQASLNPIGVNVIRKFPDAGIVIWGARTLAAKTDPEWKYVSVRRLLMFIEESIEEGTQWVVFEPNDPSLWARVKRDVSAFLTLTWRSGALFGLAPEESFFVKVDEENNPPEVRDAGRLIIDVGVAPVKPAEFVIFRFSQITKALK